MDFPDGSGSHCRVAGAGHRPIDLVAHVQHNPTSDPFGAPAGLDVGHGGNLRSSWRQSFVTRQRDQRGILNLRRHDRYPAQCDSSALPIGSANHGRAGACHAVTIWLAGSVTSSPRGVDAEARPPRNQLLAANRAVRRSGMAGDAITAPNVAGIAGNARLVRSWRSSSERDLSRYPGSGEASIRELTLCRGICAPRPQPCPVLRDAR